MGTHSWELHVSSNKCEAGAWAEYEVTSEQVLGLSRIVSILRHRVSGLPTIQHTVHS